MDCDRKERKIVNCIRIHQVDLGGKGWGHLRRRANRSGTTELWAQINFRDETMHFQSNSNLMEKSPTFETVKTSKYCPWGANGNSANDYSRSLIKGTTTSGKLCLQGVPLLQQKALPFFDNSGWTFGWHSFDLSFAEQNTSPGKGKDCLWSAAHSNIYLLEDLNAPSSTPNWNSATNGNTWLCLIYPRLGITLLKITFKLPAPLTRW